MILRVDGQDSLRISLPRYVQDDVLGFVLNNSEYILKENARIKDPYAQGNPFYFFGSAYTVQHHNKSLQIRGEDVYLDPLKAKAQSDLFYKSRAKELLPQRVVYWEERMGVKCSALGFRLAKRRWGSCNAQGRISLNPYMMKLSNEMIDYIIVHELSHLVHLNHSASFYGHIEQFLPDFRNIEKEIKSFTLRMQGF